MFVKYTCGVTNGNTEFNVICVQLNDRITTVLLHKLNTFTSLRVEHTPCICMLIQ